MIFRWNALKHPMNIDMICEGDRMTWEKILKNFPDFIGIPMQGMTNRGYYRRLAHGIFEHTGSGQYKLVSDLEKWVDGMSPEVDPTNLTNSDIRMWAGELTKPWLFKNYQGTPVYANIFQGGDKDAIYD